MWKTNALLVAAAAGGLVVLPMHNWVADLTPTTGTKVSGTATFNGDTKDVTKVTLTLENAQPNATVAWHVHQGACTAADAPVIGKESDYMPATADGSGRVNTSVSLPINLNASGYSVRVHEKSDTTSRKDYYRSQDSTSRDTTMMRDTTMSSTKDTTWKNPSPTPSDSKSPSVSACGDLRPQSGEKANR